MQPDQRQTHRGIEIGIIEAVEQPQPGRHPLQKLVTPAYVHTASGDHDGIELGVVEREHEVLQLSPREQALTRPRGSKPACAR